LRAPSRRFEVLVDGLCLISSGSLAAVCLVRYPGLRVGTPWLLESALFVLGLVCYRLLALAIARFGSGRDHLVGVLVGFPVVVVGWAAASSNSGLSVLLATSAVLVRAIAVAVGLRVGALVGRHG
jgi:hypothetical protein